MNNNIILGNKAADIALGSPNATNVVSGDAADIFAALDGNGGGLLADNGGPVLTAPLNGNHNNPALDRGLNVGSLTNDARGVSRTVDIAGVGNDGMGFVDAGAFELQVLPNNPPEVTNLFGEVFEFSYASSIQSILGFDDIVVSDFDSTDFDGGELSITQTGGPSDGDWGTFGGSSFGPFFFSFGFNGLIAEIAAGQNGLAGGPLVFNPGPSATLAEISDLVSDLAYRAPTQGDRTFSLTLDDGDDGTLPADSDVVGSFTIRALSQAPVIANLDGDSVTADNSVFTLIDVGRDAQVTDPDTTNLSGGQLIITPTSGLVGDFGVIGDAAGNSAGAVKAGAAFSFDRIIEAGDDIRVLTGPATSARAGAVSATDDGQDGTPLIIDFDAGGFLGRVTTALQGLTFSSNQPGTHTFDLTVSDDDGTFAATSDPVSFTVNVLSANLPPSLTLDIVLDELAEDSDTSTRIKLADVVIADDGMGTNTLSLSGNSSPFELDGTESFLAAGTSARIKVADIDVSDDALGSANLALAGADAALFEIDGAELFLIAGASLDFETNPALDVVVTVDDPALGSEAESEAALSLAVTDVDEPATLELTPVLTELAEDTDTAARIKVADITITDDALGTNALALSGADAALFEIDGTELFLISGAALSAAVLDVSVTLDDAEFAGLEGNEAVTLTITQTDAAPSVTLSNVISALDEDADTTAAIFVADIVVADDVQGVNTLSLGGRGCGSV